MAKVSKSSKNELPVNPELGPHEVKAKSVCAAHGNKPDELIEIFHDLQAEFGFIADDVLPVVANALNLSRAEVYGCLTFYHEFRREKPGRHVIKVCRAEACQAMGTDKLCEHVEKHLGTTFGATSADGNYSLEAVYCLGNCALSPAILIGNQLHGKVDAKRFDDIVAKLGKESAR